MFSDMDSLPAFQLCRWPNPRAVADAGPPTTDSALLDSTLITSAPWSERIRVADGPAWIQVKSSTRMPWRARPVGWCLLLWFIAPRIRQDRTYAVGTVIPAKAGIQ